MPMSVIGEWLDQEVYPALFNKADQVFPEFAFKRFRNGWISNTAQKADGSGGSSTGKVYLYEGAKHCLKDYRLDKAPSLYHYLAHREGLRENKDIVRYLSELSGVPLPERPTTNNQQQQKGVHSAVMASAHRHMQRCLQQDAGADGVWQYFGGRGYDGSEVRAMGLGYLPSKKAMKEQLLNEGHSLACVKYFMKKLKSEVGESHQLAIPCYGAGKKLEGFTFRSLAPEEKNKYLNMTGLKKSVALMDFPAGTKDLTIVEGVFDAKIAKARGIDGIVPLNGTHLSADQVEAMQGRGVESLTLCLDNDEAGRKATWNIVNKLINQCPEMRLFVAQLPEDIKDPDELMQRQGVESFRQVIDHAVNAGQYFADLYKSRLARHNLAELTPKKRDEFVTFCLDTAHRLPHPRDLHDFLTSMADVFPSLTFVQGMPGGLQAAVR